ncbi:MAG TPA: hypothetical protein VGD84_22240 [Pseudonocardiaceae bacterium]
MTRVARRDRPRAGLPSNLLAHHLELLAQAGLIERVTMPATRRPQRRVCVTTTPEVLFVRVQSLLTELG